jgi:flagellar hook-basal body protein
MPTPQATIQSLKTVDQWIDTINANINGGVRTGFKTSRLKFSGTNVDVEGVRPGGLPLQFAETGLASANTIIDFSQGAVTASTESTHLAIQGEGFFCVISPDAMNTDGTLKVPTAATKMYFTRDGEFRTDANGLLVNASGYYLVTPEMWTATGQITYNTGLSGTGLRMRGVFNDVDITTPPATGTPGSRAFKLTDFLANNFSTAAQYKLADNVTTENGSSAAAGFASILKIPRGMQSLQFSPFGSTVFDAQVAFTGASPGLPNANIFFEVAKGSDATIMNKSLEASNASMTQSVPELSLAQKLFSALTKVLQTTQTNQDALLSLIR